MAHAWEWSGEVRSQLAFALRAFAGNPGELTATLAGALLLGALCWWAASRYSRLWNLGFHLTPSHHLLCLLAAVLTLVFVVLFVSLRHLRDAAEASINLWRAELRVDASWEDRTFSLAYDAVRALGVEDFTDKPPPSAGGHSIPTSQEASITTAASVYANSAAADFRARRPLLSLILSVKPEVPQDTIRHAISKFFADGGKTYEVSRAIDIATDEIKVTLQPQTGRVVTLARVVLGALFLLVQLVPFGWIGWAAYRDLKVTT